MLFSEPTWRMPIKAACRFTKFNFYVGGSQAILLERVEHKVSLAQELYDPENVTIQIKKWEGQGGLHTIRAPSLPPGFQALPETREAGRAETPLISYNCLAYDIICPQKNMEHLYIFL